MLNEQKYSATLIYAAFIAGLCSIIYELLIATTVSYFLGDSVTYFSLTIGLYMAAMGVGSFVSKYIDTSLLKKFVVVEILLGLVGGVSIPLLYFSYSAGAVFIPVYALLTLIIGFLIGLEIPLLTRLMENYKALQWNIAHILSVDYLGALIATVSFPFVLLPFFGVYQSSLIFGLVNMSIGFVVLWVFRKNFGASLSSLNNATIALSLIIITMIVFSHSALRYWDNSLYDDRIVYSEQTRYQKIVLTRHRQDVRLFLNGNLQFSSIDEYRYHEALIHVPLSLQKTPVQRVLLLGAGDGLAVRELLKYPAIKEIVLVDLDQRMVRLAKENRYISALNEHSLDSPKVTVITSDAFAYLSDNKKLFDFIVCDLPDPNNTTLARLYSKQFYTLVRHNIAENGLFVSQATSPYFATDAFWSISKSIKAAPFDYVLPYHAHVSSFGDWGFVVASNQRLNPAKPDIQVPTRFLDKNNFSTLFVFDKDLRSKHDVKINMLDQPILLQYYLKGWKYYAR
ncbi:MAG: polyamine aminopropyltransferase [Mariprofundaceae bacterium]|nr:polyamine aminopropyltransferase [Mariprofundaceae bacterium]